MIAQSRGDFLVSEPNYVQQLTARQKGSLPDQLGLEWLEARPGFVKGRFEVKPHHLAPNTFLQAASVIALADSACGYGCIISRPEGALNFTTIELKSNFLGATRDGGVSVEASLVQWSHHPSLGRRRRSEATGKTIALFRCTQMLLYLKMRR
jgi:acyl-coenzyme A thioesterase PaaI-like protein